MRPLQLSTYSFYLMSATCTLVVPYSYRTLVLFATSSTTICLICSFCAADQIFAEDFLLIPPRNGHPCPWLDASRYKGALGTYTRYSMHMLDEQKDGISRDMPSLKKYFTSNQCLLLHKIEVISQFQTSI
jgi:uncharacterized protein YcsI (UPF0317 family)